MKLRELIKRVRGCKTGEEERSVINKESAEMRNMKEQNEVVKTRNLAKCIFIHMLGFETSFIEMTCVNLLSSPNFTEKRIAYVALCVLMDEKRDVLLLTTSTIKKDLDSTNQYIVAVALNAIGEICTPFMCRELAPEVIKLMNNPNPYIKKKAALACSKIIRKCPEFLETISDKLGTYFEDKNHGVLLCGLSLAIQVFKQEESYVDKYKKYLKNMIRYLRNLNSSNYAPEYDINGITDPFLQVKILEVLSYFGRNNPEASEEMNDLLANISTNTDTSKNTGNAVLYELVRTIIKIESSSGLKSLGSNILGKFLTNRDNNYKYIALNTLQEVGKTDINSVQKHKGTILDCLKDNDVSVKRRALDLIYVIINQGNIKQIVKECLNFLLVAENEFKLELTTKISQSLERFSPSVKWQVDTLIKMFSLAGNFLSEETVSNAINLIVNTPELQVYSLHKLFIAIQNNLGQEGLVKAGVYLLGEFGNVLISSPAQGPDGETIQVSEGDVMDLLSEINQRKYSSSSVKEYMLNSLMKLSTKLGSNSQNLIKEMIDNERTSYYAEVQQRAVEYSVFNKNSNADLKSDIAKNVPGSKVVKEENMSRSLIDEDEEDTSEVKLDKTAFKGERKVHSNKDMAFNPIGTSSKQPESSSNQGGLFFDPFSTPETTTSNQGGGVVSGMTAFDDIFKNTNQPSISGGFDMFDLTGGSKTNNPTPNTGIDFSGGITNTNTTNTNPGGLDLNLLGFQTGSTTTTTVPSTQSNPNEKQIYSNSELKITCAVNKESESFMNVNYLVSNLSSSALSNVKLTFLATKTVTVKVLSTSGTSLEGSQQGGIKKDISITNNDLSKKVVLKLKLSYSTAMGSEVNDTVTLNEF